MSENLGNTQPNIKAIKISKRWRGRTFLLSALGLIVIFLLAILIAYRSGLSIRENAASSILSQQLGEQFQYALVDIEFKHYANARQRLEYIIAHDPTFPGAQEKLTQVLVLSNAPTLTVTPSLTPTPDFSGAEQAFLQAQQLIAAQDWPGAIGTLDQIRKLDKTYKTSQVDGMYYFALRNYGYNLLTQQGNLEGGIYQFTLAERFGPLDRDANGLREGARYYLIGASFWELDWKEALLYFNQVAGYNLWDGTMTVSERIHFASMRYGDELYAAGDACGAVTQYEAAQAIAALDETADVGYGKAHNECFPATDVPTVEVTPTLGTPVATEPSTEPPKGTDTPTSTPEPSPTPG